MRDLINPPASVGTVPLTNVACRARRSLAGRWNAIVDPYDLGYVDIFAQRNDRGGYFFDRRPQHPGDRVEYSFDDSPTLKVPGDWTGRLSPGVHSLVIQVNNRREFDRIPAMRSDWWNYGGLHRAVELVEVPAVFLRDAWVTMTPAGGLWVEAQDDVFEDDVGLSETYPLVTGVAAFVT